MTMMNHQNAFSHKILTFWTKSSEEMRPGSTSTTPKRNTRVCNRKQPNPPHRKKSCMSKFKVKTRPICFFDSKGIVHTNLFFQDKQWTKHFAVKFWKVWENDFCVSYQSSCQTSGFNITSMLYGGNVLQANNSLCWTILPNLPTRLHAKFFCF